MILVRIPSSEPTFSVMHLQKLVGLLASALTAFAFDLPTTGYNQVTSFGPNPSNVGIYSYTPPSLSTTSPGLVVALHYCGGTAQDFYSGTQYAAVANEKKNFIVLFGDAPKKHDPVRNVDTKCWDVGSSQAAITRDGAGDALGIASAVRYAIQNWGVDPNKVFVVGQSSGAMMANVLAAAYPDLFKAVSVFSGVPYACFLSTNGSYWSDECATGKVIKDGPVWGNLVRAAYEGYNGTRPRMQLWHGYADETINYNNFAEELKQWLDVFNGNPRPGSTRQNDPEPGYTHAIYAGAQLEAYLASTGPHNLPLREALVVSWFGL